MIVDAATRNISPTDCAAKGSVYTGLVGIKSKSTFLILLSRLLVADLLNMIGRFVTDINNPIANSQPKASCKLAWSKSRRDSRESSQSDTLPYSK